MIEPAVVFGRVIAQFRAQEGKTQAEYAAGLEWDRSLLARIEVGRNDVSIKNVLELEAMLTKRGLITSFGDLLKITSRVLAELEPRMKADGNAEAVVDRVAGMVVDGWLQGKF